MLYLISMYYNKNGNGNGDGGETEHGTTRSQNKKINNMNVLFSCAE